MAFRHFLSNVGLILLVIIILSTAKFTKNETKLNYNVSNDIHLKPLHYDVKIKFGVYKNVFFGKCNIIIQIDYPTENITMMSSKILNVVEIDLIDNSKNQTINIQKFSVINKPLNKMYIYFNFTQSSIDYLSPGTYILQIIYVRITYDEDFFESFHIEEKDKTPTKVIKAKELFPYWDEPEFKSTFNISIWHHKSYTCFSNMPIREQVIDFDNMQWTHFDTSPSMSAEHIIIVMTRFTYSLIYLTFLRNVKLWYRQEITEQMQYAIRIIQGIVQYLVQKSTRNVSKLDLVVITDFQHTNAKNTNTNKIILLREEDIVYDNTSHPARKIEVANLIARETISYWYNDVFLWSKEGFITFLAAHILQQNSSLYDMMDLFVVQTQQESLRFDAFYDSYSLNTANTSKVYSFDESSFHYSKSFIIWRILYHILSDKAFWITINTCTNIQYNQTNATDTSNLSSIISFWSIVENVLSITNSTRNFDVEKVFNIWLTARHCPLLYVTRYYAKSFHNDSVLISYTNFQYKFYVLNNSHEMYVPYVYKIYLTYATKLTLRNLETLDLDRKIWLSTSIPSIYLYKINNYDNNWIILNLQQVGYYRVNYDLDNWQKLANYLYFTNYTHIHVLNRAQIIDDAFYFWIQKQLNFFMFLNITRFLLKDTDYVAWYPMIKAVEYMMGIWPFQYTLIIKNKIDEMFDKLLQNIGYDDKVDDTDFTKCLREEAVKWACLLDNYKCIQTAAAQLEKHLENSVENKYFKWREWIYCKGLMTANFTTWSTIMHTTWNTTKWNTHNNIYAEYLTCSTNPFYMQSYLSMIITTKMYFTVTNKQTVANIVLLIIAKYANDNAVLHFIFMNFKFFKFSLKTQVDQIAILIIIITHEYDVYQLKKVSEFVKNNLTMSDEQLVDAVKQKIIKRKQENGRLIKKYNVF